MTTVTDDQQSHRAATEAPDRLAALSRLLHSPAVFWLGLAGLVALGLGLAYALRFVQDDAFISFRYAQNLVDGHGLVWEPGVAVQGYTNFLWTVLIAGGLALGFEAVPAAQALGIAFYAVSVTAFVLLARRVLENGPVALGLGLVLVANYSFTSYATGGLETSLLTALVTLSLLLAHRVLQGPAGVATCAALSLTLAMAGLTRLDSAVLVVVLTGTLALCLLARMQRREAMIRIGALVGPGLAVFLAYAVWTTLTYGSVVPNTFHVKAGGFSLEVIRRGIYYVFTFLHAYGLLLPVILALPFLWGRRGDAFFLALVAYLGLMLAYVARVGGDFMEFRLLIPLLPAILLVVGNGWVAMAAALSRPLPLVLGTGALGFLVLVSAFHGFTYKDGTYTRPLLSIPELSRQMTSPRENWVGIGERLGALFPGGYETGPTVAIRAAGAVPYHSGLPVVDMLGLNDAWVARNGLVKGSTPGHQRNAPFRYLLDREVNLVIGHPMMRPAGAPLERRICTDEFYLFLDAEDDRQEAALAQARVLRVPIDARYELAMLALAPHPSVEHLLQSGAVAVLQHGLAPCVTKRALPS